MRKGRAADFQFIKDILHPTNQQKPSDKSTIYTAMCTMEETTMKAGQEVVVMTCDQQLYRVVLVIDIMWTDPGRWRNFYPRLGVMH